MALTTARAAAGGVNPFASDSSPLNITFKNLSAGVTDFITAKDNAFNIKSMSELQAENYREAGRSAARAGTMSALMTIGSGAMTMGKIGGPPGGGSPPSNPTPGFG